MNDFLMLLWTTAAGMLICGTIAAVFADRSERKDTER